MQIYFCPPRSDVKCFAISGNLTYRAQACFRTVFEIFQPRDNVTMVACPHDLRSCERNVKAAKVYDHLEYDTGSTKLVSYNVLKYILKDNNAESKECSMRYIPSLK